VIKAVFSVSLLQFSVSHDPSEIILIWWFAAQETFMIIINVEKRDYFYFRILWWIGKNSIYLKWKTFVRLYNIHCHFW